MILNRRAQTAKPCRRASLVCVVPCFSSADKPRGFSLVCGQDMRELSRRASLVQAASLVCVLCSPHSIAQPSQSNRSLLPGTNAPKRKVHRRFLPLPRNENSKVFYHYINILPAAQASSSTSRANLFSVRYLAIKGDFYHSPGTKTAAQATCSISRAICPFYVTWPFGALYICPVMSTAVRNGLPNKTI